MIKIGFSKIKFRFLNSIVFLIGIFAVMQILSSKLYAEDSTPASSEIVWVILDLHGSWQREGTMKDFAERSSRFALDMLAKESSVLGKPVTFWFERGTLPAFSQSVDNPIGFLKELEIRAQVPPEMFRKILRDPRTFSSAEVKAFEIVTKEMYDEQLQYQINADRSKIQDPPEIFRPWLENLKSERTVEFRYEYPPFEAWLVFLREAAWSEIGNEAFVTGTIDQAIACSLRRNVLENLSINLRDRKLSADIARVHLVSPGTLHIVFRGSYHERLAAYLNQQGISAKNVFIYSFRDKNPFRNLIANMESRAEIFEPGYVPSLEEKNIASREYIKDASAYHYGGEKIHEEPINGAFLAAINNLNDDDFSEWRELMSQPGDNQLKAATTWGWLLKKSPNLAKTIGQT